MDEVGSVSYTHLDMKYHIRKIIIDGEQSQWAETLKSMDAIKQDVYKRQTQDY